MKSLKILRNTVAVLICIIWIIQSNLNAQNQSMFLPFPGDNYQAETGSKMLNFINPSNTFVTTLPKYDFFINNVLGDPHDEADLTNTDADPQMIEKYLGQHPMFAQQVVHDKDGNLLFFIIDNNIYNKNGKAFIDYVNGSPTDYYAYLHDDSESLNGASFNRFGFPDTPGSLDPEIVVFPIHNSCYKFGIVYSIYYNELVSGSSHVYYKTLEYINEDKIIISEPIEISSYTDIDPLGCYEESSRNIAISDYRATYDNYLLFVRLYNSLSIFTIDGSGNLHQNMGCMIP